ncbi:MAG: aldehyde dehydrogenase family protein [Propionibacteriaceae bacterium]|nr:aldehyde dehydrogenase family protein [Propionibacteriaceae bacterium]
MSDESRPIRGLSGLFVNGEWVQRGGTVRHVYDKFTQVDVAELVEAQGDDIEAAITAAHRASQRPIPAHERRRILLAVASWMEAHREEILANYVTETGFTWSDAQGEFARAMNVYRLSAEEAIRIGGEQVPIHSVPGNDNRLALTIRVPVGVVVAIAPFNAPLSTVAHKIGPAIAAGNAVVLKPADATPLSAMAAVEAFRQSGLPEGFINLVCGSGRKLGDLLVGDPRVRFYTFTGSTSVGRSIAAGAGLARTHLELGSNSATIVDADADLARVCDLVTRAGFRKAGQVCTSVQRVLVHQDRFDELAERLAASVSGLRHGDPHNRVTQVGPMIALGEAERAEDWIQAARNGSRLVVGGGRTGPLLDPTLLVSPDLEARVMTEEIFAPVVSMVPVASLEAAVEFVNAGPYGLQTGVFTQDIDRAFAAARDLRVGGVIINDTSSFHADEMPYSGVKESGHGAEGPRYAVEDMTDPRVIVLNLR